MAAALGDPNHGYYTVRDPVGARGDFITAPEISQVFGELIGLWAAVVWDGLGRPEPVRVVEIGPGHGTLMADALRAAGTAIPAFATMATLHLIETSPRLRARQHVALGQVQPKPQWNETLAAVPPGPLILIANELFDVLPIRQVVRLENGWAERCIDFDGDRFVFVKVPATMPEAIGTAFTNAKPGDLIEVCPAGLSLVAEIANRLARDRGAALIIDYGHVHSAAGETLQAVRRHAFANVLDRPGETDLTAHVDFQALGARARERGAVTFGPIAQAQFLERLGIMVRAQRLAAAAPADMRPRIWAGVRRLVAPSEMGLLFKVLGLAASGQPTPPGF